MLHNDPMTRPDDMTGSQTFLFVSLGMFCLSLLSAVGDNPVAHVLSYFGVAAVSLLVASGLFLREQNRWWQWSLTRGDVAGFGTTGAGVDDVEAVAAAVGLLGDDDRVFAGNR